MLDAFIPSLIIVASTVAAFVGGRVVAFVARRWPTTGAPVRIAAALLAVAFLVLFATNGSSRYALLLPIAFAAGAFVRRDPVAPALFDK